MVGGRQRAHGATFNLDAHGALPQLFTVEGEWKIGQDEAPVKVDLNQSALPRHRDFARAGPFKVGKAVPGTRRVTLVVQNLERASDVAFTHQEVKVGEL